LACLAGLPPGLIGLFAKVVVFGAAVDGGLGWLAVVMAVNTVIALYYYLVWAAQIFAPAPAPAPVGDEGVAPVVDLGPVRATSAVPAALGVAIGVTLLAGVILSVLPQIVLQVLVSVVAGG
jgi:NADH-quinone oxidoreductase subunit N